ncbi:MAG: aminotransferase class V-fold PLP-dependent enzyme [Micavibrio sp.]
MKALFSKALADPDILHFSAHSHHLWPDASFEGHQQYWEDSARLADHKWEKVFSDIIPAVQKHIAGHLNLSDPVTIAFAPNTHEFVNRILSCLPERPAILTTDSEFHSFTRQIMRLEEDDLVRVTRIPTLPFDTFPQRFIAAAKESRHDLVFFSHVFFNSGYAIPDLPAIVGSVEDEDTLIVIDGYHGFMALPTDLAAIQHHAFYLAGGYKYAMSGEGCCFLHCPPGYGRRPRNTGWFADMGALEAKGVSVNFATDGFRFWGATFDPSGLYRMRAVMAMLEKNNLSVPVIHEHVVTLQDYFLSSLKKSLGPLVTPTDTALRGHFLTFETEQAKDIYDDLQKRGITTDYRGTRLRFGFGIYHDEADINRLTLTLKESF